MAFARSTHLHALLAALAVALAAPAAASADWSAPETIAVGSSGAETAAVKLVAVDGRAVLAWREGTNVVRGAYRPAGGPFAASQLLDADTGAALPVPAVGIAADGRATAVWASKNGGRSIRLADVPAGGSAFGAADALRVAGTPFTPAEDVTSLEATVDAAGATHVAFNGPGYAQYPRIYATTRGSGAGAGFGAPGAITGNLTPGAPGRIAMASGPNGASALTWYEPSADVAPGSQAQYVNGGIRSAGDPGWTLGTVPNPPNANTSTFFCCLALGPQGASSIAMDASGATAFTVNGVPGLPNNPLPGPNFIRVSAEGVPTDREQLDPAANWSLLTDGGDPQVALAPSGDAVVAWLRTVDGKATLFARHRPAGAATDFGPTEVVADDLPGTAAGRFAVTANEAGTVVVWEGSCQAGVCDVRSRFRPAGAASTFGTAELLATGAREGQGLQVAALPDGHALAVWRESAGDLRASRFSVPAAPTPPPPADDRPAPRPGPAPKPATLAPATPQVPPVTGTTVPPDDHLITDWFLVPRRPVGRITAPRALTIGAAVARGVRTSVAVTVRSTVEVALVVRSGRRDVVVGHVRQSASKGTVRLTVRPRAAALRRLRGRRTVHATLRIVVTPQYGTPTLVTRTVTLKRS